MAGTFPNTPAPKSIVVSTIAPTMLTVSHNLTSQRRTRNVQRFGIEVMYPSGYDWSAFAPLWAFIVKQKGRAESFDLVLPTSVMPANGSWAGAPQVRGNNQTGDSVNIQGLTASQTGICKAGDLIKFDGHNKVYQVTDDADSDGSGHATINIQPRLETSPSNNSDITIHTSSSGITFKVVFSTDEFALNLDHIVKYGITLSMSEVNL